MNSIMKILKKRPKVTKSDKSNANYWDWWKVFKLDTYFTYIFISKRNIGKTYSMFDVAFKTYENTGEWTCIMRETGIQLDEVIVDYKGNKPYPFPKYAVWSGNSIIDERNGNLIIKFVALSLTGNLASITGNNCAFLFFDEFLPRTKRRVPKAYFKLVDFMKTIERDDKLIVILQANATTLNSEILFYWDIWNDIDEIRDTERGLWYLRAKDWDTRIKREGDSTTNQWAENSKEILDYMDKAEFIEDDGEGIVVPISRLGKLKHKQMWLLNGIHLTLSHTEDGFYVISEGMLKKGGSVYALTTVDDLSKGKYIKPPDVQTLLTPIYYKLKKNKIIFTSFDIKENFFKFMPKLFGTINSKIE